MWDQVGSLAVERTCGLGVAVTDPASFPAGARPVRWRAGRDSSTPDTRGLPGWSGSDDTLCIAPVG